jgi:hypothetical protein
MLRRSLPSRPIVPVVRPRPHRYHYVLRLNGLRRMFGVVLVRVLDCVGVEEDSPCVDVVDAEFFELVVAGIVGALDVALTRSAMSRLTWMLSRRVSHEKRGSAASGLVKVHP